MRQRFGFLVLLLLLCFTLQLHAKDAETRVREAVKRSTLDQPGTHPFHLRAELAPSYERDRDSGRTGEVEFWWESPTRFRREVRSPQFHQIEVVDGPRVWQKNEGEYYPEWLREIATAIINPIPNLDQALAQVKDADKKQMMGSTYFQWSEISSDGAVQKGMGATVALTDSTGLLFYDGGLGWGGLYKDYRKFHDRTVARIVTNGSPEVKASIVVLEDLSDSSPSLFDVNAPGADSSPIHTVIIPEPELRKNLTSSGSPVWPAVQDGPLEGSLTTSVAIDRQGAVRQVGTIVSDNQALDDVARQFISAMRFRPYLQNRVPVQVVSRITMLFKTTRPAGTENFESARTYFERGRNTGFLAAASTAPYVLHAEFETATSAKKVEKGEYEDTWLDEQHWRREARIGNSRYARSRDRDKTYQDGEGSDVALLRLVLRIMEPIPAIDTFYEGDWHMKRETVNGVDTVRVLAGSVNPDGTPGTNGRVFWFDDSGDLVKARIGDLDIVRQDFQDYSGTKVARVIGILKGGALGMKIRVLDIATPNSEPPKFFQIKGHEWKRAFTDEVR